jgi:hypothetical protein
MQLIDISYVLYREDPQSPDVFWHVTTSDDLALEASLNKKDTSNHQVEKVSNLEVQSVIVYEHVLDYLVGEIGEHTVDFANPKDSKANSDGGWDTLAEGASVIFPVIPTDDPDDDSLRLAVATANAAAQ